MLSPCQGLGIFLRKSSHREQPVHQCPRCDSDLGLEGPERSGEAARLQNPSPAPLPSLPSLTSSFPSRLQEGGTVGPCVIQGGEQIRCSRLSPSPPDCLFLLFWRQSGQQACVCLMVLCCSPAAEEEEEEAEAGLSGQSGARSSRDEPRGEDAALPSAVEEERRA